MPEALAHGVGRPLEPVARLVGLLGGQDVHEAVGEHVEMVGLGDVPVERLGVELGQDEDPPDVRVEAVADGDVDEAVLARQRDGGLGAVLGQRVQPGALAAAQDDGTQVLHARPLGSGALIISGNTGHGTREMLFSMGDIPPIAPCAGGGAAAERAVRIAGGGRPPPGQAGPRPPVPRSPGRNRAAP